MSFKKHLVFILMSVVCTLVFADTSVPKTISDAITQSLKKARPDMSFDDVKPTPIDGLYRVRVNGSQFLFATADGSHMIAGDMYEVMPGRFVDVLDKELDGVRQEAMEGIPEEDFVVFPSTNGPKKAHLYVFTDIDCGYCRKLHNESIPDLNNAGVEVRYLAFPRSGTSGDAFNKLATVWCSKDSKKAMSQFKRGEAVKLNVCNDNPVADQYQLGVNLGIQATPSLVLADGTLLLGYRTAAEILAILGL